MRRTLTTSGIVLLLAFALLIGRSSEPASAAPTVVSPAAPSGWDIQNFDAGTSADIGAATTPSGTHGEFVLGPGTPPLGSGSFHQHVGTNGDDADRARTAAYDGTLLSALSTLSYSTYVNSGGSGGQATYIQLRVDLDNNGTTDDILFFEPVYQNGTYAVLPYSGAIPNQCGVPACVVTGAWQTWNAATGGWWSNNDSAGGPPLTTLADYAAHYPGAKLATDAPSVRLTVGFGAGAWDNFDGNFDNVTINGDTFDFEAPVPCTTDCYVRPDGNDLNGGAADTPSQAKKTIQAAVDAVAAGGNVHVGAGTYVEQVNIGKSITVLGAGAASTTIQSPASLATLFTTSGPNKPIVLAHDTPSVHIAGLTVDGNGQGNANVRMEGIAFYNAGGGVSNSTIVHVRDTPLDGVQHGVAIYANNTDNTARSLSITSNTISDYQKNGMALNGAGLTATVFHNTVTGAGATPVTAQNGIQIGFGAVGTVTNNTVSGNFCTDAAGGCNDDPTSSSSADGAAGVLIYEPGASNVTVSNNTLTNNQFGVWTVAATAVSITGNGISGATGNGITVFDCDVSCSPGDAVGTTGTISGNTISGQTYGIIQHDFVAGAPVPAVVAHNNSITGATTDGAWSDVPFNATDNWWGTANGPANPANTFNVGAQGDAVSANVVFVPWLNAAPPTGVSFAPVTTTSPVGNYSSIQAGVNASNSGGTVNAAAGTFTENVVVGTPVTIAGAGQASTSVIPALSSPNSCGGSLCPTSSNIFLIQANDVTIHDLTADGDNPALTSGIVAGGADIDARNGIITDHTVGVFQNLTVHDVTVKNIYLRGIYASSGGSFDFNHDTVQNVQADPASIGMFNFGGAGVFANNTVSGTNDAISANHSRGTQFLNNVITNSASGIHTDNAGDGGGVADVITGNTVSNGTTGSYGIWVFVPYIAPTFSNNTVSSVDVGMAAFGQGLPVTTTFANNSVDGAGRPNSVGAYVTTDILGFGAANSSVLLTGNVITGFTDGIDADSQSGFTTSINATDNSIAGNGDGVVLSDNPTPPNAGPIGAFVLNMTPNWWGDQSGPQNATSNPAGAGNSVADGVVYSPWIGIGTDASVAPGFQLVSPMTWVAGPAVCGSSCIQAAIDDASNGDTVKAKTGVFNEHVNVNKQITLTAGSNPIIDGGGSGDGITISVPNVTVSSFEVRNVANGIVIAAAANNATISTNNIHNFTSAAVRGTSATGATISSNTINGGHVGSCVGGFSGIIVQNVSGSIGSNTVSGIGNGLTNGCQEGRAIEADGTGTVTISNNTVTQYQKSGIIVRDTVNSSITGNTTTGEGPTAGNAMNGITITSSGTATVSGNHTGFNRYTPESDFACGILYFPTGNPAPGALTISGNDSTEDEVGICLTNGSATAPVSGVSVTNNTITKHHQQAINIDSMTNVTVSGNQIDGQAGGTTANPGSSPDTDTRYYGIFAVDSTGTISNNTIKGITHGPSNGIQSGVGIRLSARTGNASNMTISGNTISDIQKGAIVVLNPYGGTSVNAVVSGNTVTGNGPINYIAQNGIQVSSGATAQVDGNNVSGYDYTPNTAAAIGILVLQAGPVSVTNNTVHDNMEGQYVQQTDNATVTGNTFTNTRDTAIFVFLSNSGTYTSNTFTGKAGSTGLYVYDASTNNVVSGNAFTLNDYGVFVDFTGGGAPTGNHFNQNCIAGNTVDGMATAGTVVTPVDATQNWWGTDNGADPTGHGDKIDPPATIDASGFLVAPTAGCPVPADLDGDGIANASDNCASVYNPDQANSDQFNSAANLPGTDALGDACDPDIDGDGYTTAEEVAIGKNDHAYCSIMRADVNNDGRVNLLDIAAIGASFLHTVPPANARLSQNADSTINLLDLATVANLYGQRVTSCP